jgi:hypothetical protein
MALSRKHYEMVAAALKDCLASEPSNRPAVGFLAGRFIVEFSEDNSRFDGERFLLATGLAN